MNIKRIATHREEFSELINAEVGAVQLHAAGDHIRRVLPPSMMRLCGGGTLKRTVLGEYGDIIMWLWSIYRSK